jgi:hypothetical protein
VAIVAALLLAGVFVFAWRKGRPAANGERPSDCVSALIAACRAEDVAAYLDRFAPPLRDRIEAQLAAGGRHDQVAASLGEQVADLKGLVTTDVEAIEPDQVRLVVERVYAEFHERQTVRLRRVEGRWKIAELGPLRRIVPEIPYGAPAAPLADEAE